MVAVGGVALGGKMPRITDFCNCIMGFQSLAMRLATDGILCPPVFFPICFLSSSQWRGSIFRPVSTERRSVVSYLTVVIIAKIYTPGCFHEDVKCKSQVSNNCTSTCELQSIPSISYHFPGADSYRLLSITQRSACESQQFHFYPPQP